MNLGLLFLKRTDKQGWFRNIVIIFAMTLATAVLLSSMAFGNALIKRSERQDALMSSLFSQRELSLPLEKNGDATLISRLTTFYDREVISEWAMYQVTDKAPLLPGLVRQPTDKEMFVSPGLMDFINKHPDIKERYKDYDIKVAVPDSMLLTPNEKVALYKARSNLINNPSHLQRFSVLDTELLKMVEKHNYSPSVVRMYINIFMALCGAGVCFPLLILVISATRVGMVQREQRYAALSLIGAPKSEINRIILTETLAASGLAVIFGTGVFFIFKHFILEKLELNNDVMFAKDITVAPLVYLGIVGAVILVAIVVNWWALRKVKTSPLGVVKNQKKIRRPSILGLIPLVLATIIIFVMNYLGAERLRKIGYNWLNLLLLVTFVLIMIGILTAGAYITYVVARLLERLSQHSVTLMATKRLQLFARPIFSSVSGAVLALFVGSFFMSLISSTQHSYQNYYRNQVISNKLDRQENQDTTIRFETVGLFGGVNSNFYQLFSQHPELSKLISKSQVIQRYVSNSLLGYQTKKSDDKLHGRVYTCEQLRQLTTLTCPSHLQTTDRVIVKQNLENQKNELVQVTDKVKKNGQFRDSEIIMHFRNSADKQKAKRILQNLIAANSRQTGAYGSIRTTDNTFDPISSVRGLIQAVTAGIAITIVVAGFSLAVAMIGSFFERKKSFHNLRLMGLDIKSLNKVVLLESVLPLFLASIIATAAGLLVTYFMITTLNTNFVFSMPGWEYFAMIIGSIAITLMIIVATLPILKRITELEQNRTE